MTTTDSPVTEPSPAPDISRAVPTTHAHRVAFAALTPEAKQVVRSHVATLLARGTKKRDAWTAALDHDPVGSVSDAEVLSSGADRDALYARAMERKKVGPRGKGRALTEDELVAFITEIRTQEPNADRRREMEIAYWLEGISLSATRWTSAWDAATERLAS